MKLRLSIGVALLLCAIALTACGGSSKSTKTVHATNSAKTTSVSPVVAAYRHVLETNNSALNGDGSQFDSCSIAFNPGACLSWTHLDRSLLLRFVGQLHKARVPAGDATANAQLIRGLRRLAADDAALARAVRAAKLGTTPGADPRILAAETSVTNDPNKYVFPLLKRLDPGISVPTQ
jgi:hypothetical protein